MLPVVRKKRLLKRAQLEEVAFLRDSLHRIAAEWALPSLELGFRNEHLVDGAVPPLVFALVDVPAILHTTPECLRRRKVTGFCRPDEIVVRDIQRRKQIAELL